MDNTIPTTKKLGRKALPEDKKRVRIGCRVSPQTMSFLLERTAVQGCSMGKVIDFVAEAWLKAERPQPLQSE